MSEMHHVSRFFAKFKMGRGCWQWRGSVTDKGYGHFHMDGKGYQAHRVAYMLFVSKIPDGKCIDHLCRNRACVNPNHLEVVTWKENILRGIGFSAVNSRKTRCIRGHKLSGHNLIIRSYDGTRMCRQCANYTARKGYWKMRGVDYTELLEARK